MPITNMYLNAIRPLTQSDVFDTDDLTAEIMDEIRDVLKKYASHFPEWNSEDIPDNLDDDIYASIYDNILHQKQVLANIAKYKNNHTHN